MTTLLALVWRVSDFVVANSLEAALEVEARVALELELGSGELTLVLKVELPVELEVRSNAWLVVELTTVEL